jgi:hypothetical protein
MARMTKKPRETPSWLAQAPRPQGRRGATGHPDEREVFPGGVTLERHGRIVSVASKRTPAAQAALEQRLREHHPAIVAKVQRAVDECAMLIPQLEPLAVMNHAYADIMLTHLGKETESELGSKAGLAQHVLEYAQCMIVSLPPLPEQRVPTEEDWDRLVDNVGVIYHALLMEWLLTDSAVRKHAKVSDDQFADLRAWLFMQWLAVRGARYTVHERERLVSLLAPHDAELRTLFSVGANDVADAVDDIQVRHTKRHGEAFQKTIAIHAATFSDENMAKVDLEGLPSGKDAVDALVAATGRREELLAALDEAFGNTLFDVTDMTAAPLFDKLALAPGEDAEFFSGGEHCGWPLRTPPTWFKPFLRIAGRLYCFYPYFTDSFYRAVSRVVRNQDKAYDGTWNRLQQEVSERIPLDIFRLLLPGAEVTSQVFYKVPRASGAGTDWCECDAVITADELMIVLEVKGGALAYTPPASDLPAYISSIEKLLVDPSEQAQRFVDVLNSADEVTLCDASHRAVRSIRRADFPTVVRCAVTLDQLTEIAGVFQNKYLPGAGKAMNPTWCVSIDDLMVCRDVFSSPVRFFHFLKYRLQAFASSKLHGFDELDHVGAYLAENAYVDKFNGMPAHHVSVTGYRDVLDRFFQEWWATGVRPVAPTQPLSVVLAHIIALLERDRPEGYLRCGAALLDLDGETRDALASVVELAKKNALAEGVPKTVDLSGPEFSLFVHVLPTASPTAAQLNTCREHARALVSASPHESAATIEISLSDTGAVLRVGCCMVSVAGLDAERLSALRQAAEKITVARFARARKDGFKLGRNDKCSCGSGKKYKKCHLLQGA